MHIEEKKQLAQPFTKDELKEIFDILKASDNKEFSARYEAKLYNGYMPFLVYYAKKYKVRKDESIDLYNDIFSKIFNAVWEGRQRPEAFGIFMQNNLARECLHIYALKNSKNEVNNESLTNPKVLMEAIITESSREKETAFNRESLLMIIAVLNEIEKDEELRKIYNITAAQIKVVKDFHGINSKNKAYTIEELAKKYNKSELVIKGLLNSGMKQIRKIEELDSIRTR